MHTVKTLQYKPLNNPKETEMTESVSLTVTGMKCGGCETNVTGKLQAIDGVLSVKASSKDNEVNVEFDAEKTSLDVITDAITEAGFSVETS